MAFSPLGESEGALLCLYRHVLDWFAFLVDESNAEVAHTRTVDDGTTEDVTSLIER